MLHFIPMQRAAAKKKSNASPEGDIFLPPKAKLVLKDGTIFEGRSFGVAQSIAGEVVFTTGMVGYPEALTDASYAGQILVFSYPLIGNYGVPREPRWESDRIRAAGVVIAGEHRTPFHAAAERSLHAWLAEEGVPGIEIKDTRAVVLHLREAGSVLGKIICGSEVPFSDPNRENLVARVSRKDILKEGSGGKHVVLIDCGAKRNIARELLRRGVRVTVVPWDFDILSLDGVDGIVISNGPGDPKLAGTTIATVRRAMERSIPILGICLGHQLLALAAGGDTRKLKFGHRGQNQPVALSGTGRSYLTTQNHGYAVSTTPPGFRTWFINANDGTNEGLVHPQKPFMSVQFHPEAAPGPEDTNWIFDEFLECIR